MVTIRKNILIAEDDPSIRLLIKKYVMELQFNVIECDSVAKTLEFLKTKDVEMMILDFRLADGNADQILKEFKFMDDAPQTIVISAYGSARMGLELLEYGVIDFCNKPVHPEDLKFRILKALRQKSAHRENKALKIQTNASPVLVGEDPKFLFCKELAEKAALSDSTILIMGETGTGKDVLARYIHNLSPRANKPFIQINAATLSDELMLDELFGHEKGAFTGAHAAIPGKIEIADGGTIFLDEIGDMSPSVQGKLLTFLETRRYTRIGGVIEKYSDVRFITATNRNLPNKVRSEEFREDLFFRFNVFPITVPVLRERKTDIPLLITHFLSLFKHSSISNEALNMLLNYDYPGNIRELKNIIERAIILAGKNTVEIEHLPELETLGDNILKFSDLVSITKQEKILELMEKNDGNKTLVAKDLNISRQHLHRLINRYKIQENNPEKVKRGYE